ncbi:Hsp20/alpha crystallin family protein [Marinobacter sp.]|uniref:Hsp20/alpha crystallin family protein n=1 Tax=Marinobacter sp. TaxID=50741 RepID=UPI001B690CB7|nr:Hsp20/alpha crystallin family protein [Marinobacter sp.]MBQ0834136.1 Hsp20/alpha crystallin family protein [Marinobacter sp.]
MPTLHQLREGLHEAWGSLIDGWQRLYRRAAGAITRFSPGKKAREDDKGTSQEIAVRSAGWGVLAAEVFDDDDQIVVRLEAPGLEKSDFDLEVLDNYLVVRGEKQIERERTEGRYHVTECAYGRFERAIPLPDEVDSSKARANYNNGVLRIELPKSSLGHRRTISVDVH